MMLIRSFAVIAGQIVFAALATVAFSATAKAQALTFVSATGVDTRPCTVQAQPCKTLQRAVTVTTAGGSIRVLSDLQGQNVTIAKSLTIEGGGNSVIGTIIINNASAVVTLRRLNLTGRGVTANGIRILAAAAVHIEDSTVERYTNDGIKLVATTPTKLFISDSVSRASSDGLYADAANAQVVIQNSRFDQNYSSGVYLNVAKASVTGGSASGNLQHGFILNGVAVKITGTTASNNARDGFTVRTGTKILNAAEASGNGEAGLHVEDGSIAFISDCVFVGYSGTLAIGVNNDAGATVYTRGNNTVLGVTGTINSFTAF
jgi:hypothetical protein